MGIDFNSPFGGDIQLGPQPDISLLGKRDNDFDFLLERAELVQRIVRRLLTSPGEWIPFPNYGAGLRQKVGETLTQRLVEEITQTCSAQIQLEPDVSASPPPVVEAKFIPDGLQLSIKLFTKSLNLVSFTFNPRVFGG